MPYQNIRCVTYTYTTSFEYSALYVSTIQLFRIGNCICWTVVNRRLYIRKDVAIPPIVFLLLNIRFFCISVLREWLFDTYCYQLTTSPLNCMANRHNSIRSRSRPSACISLSHQVNAVCAWNITYATKGTTRNIVAYINTLQMWEEGLQHVKCYRTVTKASLCLLIPTSSSGQLNGLGCYV